MFTFNSQVGANDIGGGSGVQSDVILTKVSGTGTVAVGEEATFSGLTSLVPAASGISNGEIATYQGSGIFNGEVGYVFTAGSTLMIPGTVLVLFDGDVISQALINRVSDYSTGDVAQVLTPDPACFGEGTLIATPEGEVAVETLRIGDLVVAEDGRPVRVKWVGRQTVSTRFGPSERLKLVRLRAGALGSGVPVRDLMLTADHALLIDGLLINAGALVNGDSIAYVPLSELGERYTVYHVETENHDVIRAEGAPAETYIDYVARQAFDNYAEYQALYGEEQTIAELPYARVSSARMLPPAMREGRTAPRAALR